MVGSHLESGLSVQSTLQVSGLHDSTCLHTGECGFTAYSSDRGLFQLGKCPAQALLAAGCESPELLHGLCQDPCKKLAEGCSHLQLFHSITLQGQGLGFRIRIGGLCPALNYALENLSSYAFSWTSAPCCKSRWTISCLGA